jgi:hypothetical protein
MGDAGFIAQITDTVTGMAVTNTSWRGRFHGADTVESCRLSWGSGKRWNCMYRFGPMSARSKR